MFEKYYSMLFALPRASTLLVVLILVIFISILLFRNNSVVFLSYIGLSLAILTIYAYFSDSVFYSVKRIVGLVAISSIYALVIGFFTNYLVGIISSAAILIVAILGLDGTSVYRYLVAVSPIIALVILMAFLGYEINYYKALFATAVIAILDYIVYMYLSRYKIGNYPSTKLGTLFLANWLEGRRDLEKVFEKIGKDTIINPVILKNRHLALIYTDIHYGPFNNLGSSMFPEMLDKVLRRENIIPIVLHGSGSHERDLVSYNYSIDLLNAIYKLIRSNGIEQKYYGVFQLHGNDDWVLTCLVFSSVSLIFVSRPYGGIDDLPYSIQELVDKYSTELGIGKVLVIDSHNWEKTREYNIAELEKLVKKTLEKIAEVRKGVGIIPLIRTTEVKVKSPGVIGDRVTVLEISGEGKPRFVLLYFRANNIAPGLRNTLINAAKSVLGENVIIEVITNDEHSETGIKPRVTYVPVQPAKTLLSAVKELLERLSESRVSTGIEAVLCGIKTRVLGDSVFSLVDLLRKAFPRSVIAILLYLFLSPIIAYLVIVF